MTPARGAAVVTGGTGGLGAAIVAAFVAEGRRVAVPYRGQEGASRLREAHGEAVLAIPADIADKDAATAFAATVEAELGAPQALVCAAGGYRGGPGVAEAATTDWQAMLDLNLMTAVVASRAFLPRLGRGGAIVYVSSRIATHPFAGGGPAIVSKAAVLALARVVALEAAASGVRANTVLPGVIDTPANRRAMPNADRGGWVSPQRIAGVVAWLCSDAAGDLSGAELGVHPPG